MMERPLRNLKVMRFRSNVLLTNEKMRRTTWGLAYSERTMLASAVICYQPEFQHDVKPRNQLSISGISTTALLVLNCLILALHLIC